MLARMILIVGMAKRIFSLKARRSEKILVASKLMATIIRSNQFQLRSFPIKKSTLKAIILKTSSMVKITKHI